MVGAFFQETKMNPVFDKLKNLAIDRRLGRFCGTRTGVCPEKSPELFDDYLERPVLFKYTLLSQPFNLKLRHA